MKVGEDRWVRIPAELNKHGFRMTLGPTDAVTAAAIMNDLPRDSGVEILSEAPAAQAEQEGAQQ